MQLTAQRAAAGAEHQAFCEDNLMNTLPLQLRDGHLFVELDGEL